MALTKAEMAERLFEEVGLNKREAKEFVDLFFDALRESLREIRTAIDQYRLAAEQGRIVRKIGESGYPSSLEVLVTGVTNAQDPKGGRIYFLRRLPRDPFFREAQVPAAATWGLRSYASPADAPAPGADVFDVYSRAPGVGLNGLPYREW